MSRPAKWRGAFIEALATCGNVRMAARAAGIDHTSAYGLRSRDAAFDAQWQAALATVSREGARPVAVPGEEEVEVVSTRSGRIVAVGSGRFGPRARETFLAEMAATGSVRRSARACGFSEQALYKQRDKDPSFAKAWNAARRLGHARIVDLAADAAQAQFDPDTLPECEGLPKVTTREMLDILKFSAAQAEKEEAALAAAHPPAKDEAGSAPDAAAVAAARAAVLDRLERLAAELRDEKLAQGWREVEGGWVPPGWTPGPADGGDA
ncbi:hypothetical protein [Sphingomicrobium astaxanthinifaciens]|uniref:hypothetical protein n=1 Tax=Sphingomicrobium astaxanthinifaciens TaxID=1227949 RepID=UPI001FCBAAFA|nr:hypothetical protein [Sphingomicrobium astaxanthinifaciens]MCJ7421601.1 hypothetical protein [Sphingomicrobium astaxanthinifaciens]